MARQMAPCFTPTWRRALIAAFAVVGALVPAPTLWAADLLRDASAWRFVGAPGTPAAEFDFEDGGLSVRAENAVGFLYRPVSDAKTLVWRWRVDQPIPPSDQAEKGADDRAVAVHLWFNTGRSEDLVFGPLTRAYGYPRITHLITYVWGGSRPRGSVVVNPYYDRGVVIVLRPGETPLRAWTMERRDIQADLLEAFGGAVRLDDLAFVAVSADTDHLRERAAARVADLRLEAD